MSTIGQRCSIDQGAIDAILRGAAAPPAAQVRDVLARARSLAGLGAEEVAALSAVTDPALVEELFQAALAVKQAIYGARLVLFAPVYASNRCANDCAYCAFRAGNPALVRRTLTAAELAEEAAALAAAGHRRVLLVAGEAGGGAGATADAVAAIYGASAGEGRSIRRVNVNVAPLAVEEFRRLRAARIGTYQLFQETYHPATYARVHTAGRKADYGWRLDAMDRAMEAGIEDVGLGVLLGLHDWRWELQALLQHARHLEARFGVGPHTISVPRLEPAEGAPLAAAPPAPVGDADFFRLVAILRLAVPYTGIIMSTREGPEVRRRTFALGVSQISAGSRTDPGGYAAGRTGGAQFQLGDHRTLDEVVRDVAALGYVPSFCTACYRRGRTGRDFMDLARPGAIRHHCDPNALSTCLEYLLDHASPATAGEGERLLARALAGLDAAARARAVGQLAAVRAGRRDVLV